LHSFVVLCEMNILSLVSQNLDNFYQIQTKCYRNSDTMFFSPIYHVGVVLRTTQHNPSMHLSITVSQDRQTAVEASMACRGKKVTTTGGPAAGPLSLAEADQPSVQLKRVVKQ